MDKNLDKSKRLPSEILFKIYFHIQDAEDRKTWQLVCRRWHLTINDAFVCISIRVPAGSSSYQLLAADLKKYPTFGPKVLSISDYNTAFYESFYQEEKEEESFKQVLYKCTSVIGLSLSRTSLEWLNYYANTCDKLWKQLKSSSLKKIEVRDYTTANDITTDYLLEVCFEYKKSIAHLDIFLEKGGISDTVLIDEYGGLVQYISQFPKLKSLMVWSRNRTFTSSRYRRIPINLTSLIARSSEKLEVLGILDFDDFNIFCSMDSCLNMTAYTNNNRLKMFNLCLRYITSDILEYVMSKLSRLEKLVLVGRSLYEETPKAEEAFRVLLVAFEAYCIGGKLKSVEVKIYGDPSCDIVYPPHVES